MIDLSSEAAKAGLAGGAGVATLGAWLLEAATAGKAKFAADVLATLDGLPIGMKALRSAGIGKTVSASQAQLHIPYRSRDDRPEASGPGYPPHRQSSIWQHKESCAWSWGVLTAHSSCSPCLHLWKADRLLSGAMLHGSMLRA